MPAWGRCTMRFESITKQNASSSTAESHSALSSTLSGQVPAPFGFTWQPPGWHQARSMSQGEGLRVCPASPHGPLHSLRVTDNLARVLVPAAGWDESQPYLSELSNTLKLHFWVVCTFGSVSQTTERRHSCLGHRCAVPQVCGCRICHVMGGVIPGPPSLAMVSP